MPQRWCPHSYGSAGVTSNTLDLVSVLGVCASCRFRDDTSRPSLLDPQLVPNLPQACSELGEDARLREVAPQSVPQRTGKVSQKLR